MQEDFLHFVWKHKNFALAGLKTTEGEPLQIIVAGEHNTNAGPDFLNAQLMVGDTYWAGHVEIHLKTSDWAAHGHSADPAYDNVILHVVYRNDKPETSPAGVPVLELAPYIAEDTIKNYSLLKESMEGIPCRFFLPSVLAFTRQMWLDRMLIERLEIKAGQIAKQLRRNGNDWSETAYQLLARNFGFHVNAPAFEHLSEKLPLKIITKHAGSLFQLEALVYGQAGFLEDEDAEDEYFLKLQKEYRFLAVKYGLKSMAKAEWKFLRLRPDNFPSIRLAQFAAFMQQADRLFSRLLELRTTQEATELLQVSASAYWDEHFRFGVNAQNKSAKAMGKASRELVIINTLAPLLFAYGEIKDQPRYKEQAIDMLEHIKAEKNHILDDWEALGMENKDARHSQALLHLKKEYCDRKRCLHCAIGTKILKPSRVS